MPGLRPPQPSDYDDDDDSFYIDFNFLQLQAQADGKIILAMTFEQITGMLTNIEDQLDGDELAEDIISLLKRHFKNARPDQE